MDRSNREGDIPYDPLFPEPPTLTECILDFGYVRQGSRKTLRQVIMNATAQPMIWLGHTGESKWITLEPGHGVLQPGERQSICVTADTYALAAGDYCVTLTFSSEGDETSTSRNMLSKVKVEETSMSQVPPSSPQVGLHLGWLMPQSMGTTGLVINNPDTHDMEWDLQIASDSSQAGKKVHLDHLEKPDGHWQAFSFGQYQGLLNLSEKKGVLAPGASTIVYVTANSNLEGLESKTFYTTNLILTSGAGGTPATSVYVPVSFYVSMIPYDDGGPKIPEGLPPNPPVGIIIPANQNQGQTSMSFTNVINDTTVYWAFNLDAGVDWLTVNPSSGSYNPGETDTVELTATRGNLQVGSHIAYLHLELSNNANMNPANKIAQPIPVTVAVK